MSKRERNIQKIKQSISLTAPVLCDELYRDALFGFNSMEIDCENLLCK